MSSPADTRLGLPDLLAAAGLIVSVFTTYSGVLDHTFLLNWDDLSYVVANEAVQGLTWSNLTTAFGRFYVGNYAPLHILSYSIDHAVWGLRPVGFLLTNVLLHSINGVLVYLLLVRLGVARLAALLGAAVFLLHPVAVESVAWISERKNLLSMTFFLTALHAYSGYRHRDSPRGRGVAYLASLTAFVAALLTKAAAVILPPLLLLFDLCFVEPASRRRWLLDKAPFVASAIAATLVTLASQARSIEEGRAVFGMDPGTTFFTMTPVVVEYLRMLVWPVGLCALYAPPVRSGPDMAVGLSALLLTLVALAGVVIFRTNRRMFFWYATFFIGFVPVLQIVPLPTLMNDRYMYFPMLGFGGFVAMAAELPLRSSSIARRTALLTATALLVSLGAMSRVRAEAWRDDLSLWRDVADKTPRSSLAWVGLGMSLVDAGRQEEALRTFLKALEVDPYHRLALNNVGVHYNQRGLPEMGRPYLLRAIQVAPDYFEASMNLGVGYRMSGDLVAAAKAFRQALSLRPGSADAIRELRACQIQIDGGPAPP